MSVRRSRRIALALGLAILAAAVWSASASLGTCGALDRLFGRSGCTASFRLADFKPLQFRTMMPAGGSRMRLFGHQVRGRDIEATQLVLDLANGEVSREALSGVGRTPLLMIPSPDQTTAAFRCIEGNLCDALRPQGFTYSVRDGRILRELPLARFGGWDFANDAPAKAILFEQVEIENGAVLASPDPRTGGIVLTRSADGAEVARLTPPNPTDRHGDPYAFYVRASPSGRFLAVINRVAGSGTRLDVWDAAERRLLRTLTTDGEHRFGPTAAWSGDERHLIGLRYREEDLPGQPGAVTAETDVFVFKVR